MTLNEFRTKVSESGNVKWLNSLSITANYPHIGGKLPFTGISSIYEFILKEADGWQKMEDLPNELLACAKHFQTIKGQLIQIVESTPQQMNSINNIWRAVNNQMTTTNNNMFSSSGPEIGFLLKINEEFKSRFKGAYNLLIGTVNLGSKEDFIGALYAYEFINKSNSAIAKRSKSEKGAFSKLNTKYVEYVSESETHLVNLIKSTNDKFDEYAQAIDEMKDQKDEEFQDWFDRAAANFEHFEDQSKNKISELENTYEELLRLKKPAEYWNSRADTLKKEGWRALIWLGICVLIACTTLYFLLWKTPDGMIESFKDGSGAAIKWSIVYVTFLSFLVFTVRALYKVVFSAFHLARDAEERQQLSYVYLALLKDSNIDENERHLIMQSLFSRADTGLLKEDSAPTMPNDIVGKIFWFI